MIDGYASLHRILFARRPISTDVALSKQTKDHDHSPSEAGDTGAPGQAPQTTEDGESTGDENHATKAKDFGVDECRAGSTQHCRAFCSFACWDTPRAHALFRFCLGRFVSCLLGVLVASHWFSRFQSFTRRCVSDSNLNHGLHRI